MAKYFRKVTPYSGGVTAVQYSAVGSTNVGTNSWSKEHPEHPVARLSAIVRRGHTIPNFNFSNNQSLPTGDSNSNELFTTEPDTLQVSSVFSHTKMRHTVPIMAAHLHQQFNLPITADDDLSKHSSSMVQHAQKIGLPVVGGSRNPKAVPTNDFTFSDYQFTAMHDEKPLPGFTRIPEQEIKSAKHHFRELRSIGRATPKPLSPQFDQPRLPGMENQ
jgi:hypothetical protein